MNYYVCKNQLPHQFRILHDFKDITISVCELCGRKIRERHDNKGRDNNIEYLKWHIRDTAQPYGRTKAVYMRCYHPQYMTIKLCLDCKDACTHKSGARTELRIDTRIKPEPGKQYWNA